MSYTAAKNNEFRRFSEVTGDGITVKDMNEFIASKGIPKPRGEGKLHFASGQSEVNSEKRIKDIARSLTPYSKCLPGTSMYKSLLRTQALSLVSSPVVSEKGRFTWFYTNGQADSLCPYLFAIIDHDSDCRRSYSDSFEAVGLLDEKTRITILRSHPALSVRCYHWQQDAFWTHVIMGKSQPLGSMCTCFVIHYLNHIIYLLFIMYIHH